VSAVLLVAATSGSALAGWSTLSLHPGGPNRSVGEGIGGPTGPTGSQQVGSILPTAGPSPFLHATIWSGSAGSAVDVHPATGGYLSSYLNATDGTQQVGWANGSPGNRAGVWAGSGASFVNLHPVNYSVNYSGSFANDVSSGRQVGGVHTNQYAYAARWQGTAASFVNSHPGSQYQQSWAMGTNGTETVGMGTYNGVAERALAWNGSTATAVSLHRIFGGTLGPRPAPRRLAMGRPSDRCRPSDRSYWRAGAAPGPSCGAP